MPMTEALQAQIEDLATLLVLDEEIRNLTNIRELGFFSTNETHRLIQYHTAYLWQSKELIGTHLITQSGTAEIDIHAPINQWLKHKINELRIDTQAKDIYQINFEQFKENSDLPEGLPKYALWCPLLNKENKISGGLIFFREEEFSEHEIKMLRWLIASYQYTWLILLKSPKIPSFKRLKEKPYFIGLGLLILCIMFFPVRISVIGSATVMPKSPALINSPMQGVIKSFAVAPGDTVTRGQLLLTIDKTDLQAAADVSQKDFLLTEAKIRAATNESFDNKDSRAEIPILTAQLAIDKAQLDYANELLDKTDVTSPIAGIVIFDSRDDWIGQPIRTGERILVVANPQQVELKITLPVTNMIELSVGSKGEFFLYGKLNALSIHIKALGYNAKLMPNKILAYQFLADFNNPNDIPQIGAQGTVKVYGHHVPFIYYLIRRPLQAIRLAIGV